ncbi:MAG: hypothetical protein U0470_11545 [Anaerolineae bacterium]
MSAVTQPTPGSAAAHGIDAVESVLLDLPALPAAHRAALDADLAAAIDRKAAAPPVAQRKRRGLWAVVVLLVLGGYGVLRLQRASTAALGGVVFDGGDGVHPDRRGQGRSPAYAPAAPPPTIIARVRPLRGPTMAYAPVPPGAALAVAGGGNGQGPLPAPLLPNRRVDPRPTSPVPVNAFPRAPTPWTSTATPASPPPTSDVPLPSARHRSHDRTPTPTAATPTSPPPAAPCDDLVAGARLVVHVVDAAGRPLEDADVVASRWPGAEPDSVSVTRPDGCTAMSPPDGPYRVMARLGARRRWHPDADTIDAAAVVDVADGKAVRLGIRLPDDAVQGATDGAAPTATATVSATAVASATSVAAERSMALGAGASPPPRDMDRRAGARSFSPPRSGEGDRPGADIQRLPLAAARTSGGQAAAAPLDQSGGAVTDVAIDDASGVVWATIGPRLTTWRLVDGAPARLGATDVLEEVAEHVAIGGGNVAIGVHGRGAAARLLFFDRSTPAEPRWTATVPLALSGAQHVGGLSVGAAAAWVVTERGLSVVDLKPSPAREVAFVRTGGPAESGAWDTLPWQGDAALLDDGATLVVVRPWGTWVVDVRDPAQPVVVSDPRGRTSDARWPSFALACAGLRCAFVDVGAAGAGVVRMVDFADPASPHALWRLDLDPYRPARAVQPAPNTRDDPFEGRSRGPAIAWSGSEIAALMPDGTWAARIALAGGEPAAVTAAPMAAWDTSFAGIDLARSAAGAAASIVAAVGDGGLLASSPDGTPRRAADLPPPVWQFAALGDDWIVAAAGPAGLSVIRRDADGWHEVATALRSGVDDAAACGPVVGVAAAATSALALTTHCGLVAVDLADPMAPALPR